MRHASRAGFWRPGDDAGSRHFQTLFTQAPLELTAGGALGPITVAYETLGTLDRAHDNAVLVLHALTGDSHVAGPAGPGHPTPGWWDRLVGPGKAIDTNRWFVVCPNVLGGCQGSTGPSSAAPDGRPYGSRFPTITVRDQVEVEVALSRELGIDRWAAVIGGSMGGMRALEWVVGHPDRVASAVVLATGAAATADQIGLGAAQVMAIRTDPAYQGGDYYDVDAGAGPQTGMGLARRIGHLSYRSELELAARFGRDPETGEDPLRGGRYAVQSYLDHHAAKLGRRFDPNSYIVLTEAMNHHDVGRGRGGVAEALRGVTAAVAVVGISSDRLYPLRLQREIADRLRRCSGFRVVDSLHGHDGFLVEWRGVGGAIADALGRSATGDVTLGPDITDEDEPARASGQRAGAGVFAKPQAGLR